MLLSFPGKLCVPLEADGAPASQADADYCFSLRSLFFLIFFYFLRFLFVCLFVLFSHFLQQIIIPIPSSHSRKSFPVLFSSKATRGDTLCKH